jgi:hypothetical protein
MTSFLTSWLRRIRRWLGRPVAGLGSIPEVTDRDVDQALADWRAKRTVDQDAAQQAAQRAIDEMRRRK